MKKKLLLTTVSLLLFSSSYAQTTHTVTMAGDVFTPSTLTINVGDIVLWSNNDTDAHTSTSGQGCSTDGLWDSGTLTAGQSFSRTFSTPGSFPYHCTFHCGMGMVGTITVNSTSGIRSSAALLLPLESYPNPFENELKIQFELKKAGSIRLEIYSLIGEKVWVSEEVSMPEGKQIVPVVNTDMKAGSYVCKVYYNGSLIGAKQIIRKN